MTGHASVFAIAAHHALSGNVTRCRRVPGLQRGNPRYTGVGPPDTRRGREDRMRRVLVVAASVIFFDTLLYGILIPLTPVYAEHLGVSKGTIGVIFALYGIPLILFSAPLGILADRIGRTPVLRGAMALLALATAVFAFATQQTNIALLVV